jgi:hypothetical protein
MALKRLRSLLDQIPKIRSSVHDAADPKVWEKNVKIVLAEFYGENSLTFKEFDHIWFTPGRYYYGQPDSNFVKALNSGLDQAAGFLQSRINDLNERIEHEAAPVGLTSAVPAPNNRKVFVVHGHDHGNKETVARFLGKFGPGTDHPARAGRSRQNYH